MKKLIHAAIVLISILILNSCNEVQNNQYAYGDCNIGIDLKNERISLSNKSLGTVLDTIQLQVAQDGAVTTLRGWKLAKTNDGFNINTSDPISSSWNFKGSAFARVRL
jgi:hypothetical protein